MSFQLIILSKKITSQILHKGVYFHYMIWYQRNPTYSVCLCCGCTCACVRAPVCVCMCVCVCVCVINELCTVCNYSLLLFKMFSCCCFLFVWLVVLVFVFFSLCILWLKGIDVPIRKSDRIFRLDDQNPGLMCNKQSTFFRALSDPSDWFYLFIYGGETKADFNIVYSAFGCLWKTFIRTA